MFGRHQPPAGNLITYILKNNRVLRWFSNGGTSEEGDCSAGANKLEVTFKVIIYQSGVCPAIAYLIYRDQATSISSSNRREIL